MRKIDDLELIGRVNNIMHEALHTKEWGYKHRGNHNNEFNHGTVPYKVGDLFQQYMEENFPDECKEVLLD